MRLLIKFISERKYVSDFLTGKLYMNTLDYFWSNGFAEQRDLFEGTVQSLSIEHSELPDDLKQYSVCDMRVRAQGYRYCNVCCFYQIPCNLTKSLDGRLQVEWDSPNSMDKFGPYIVIIKDEQEFVRRVARAAEAKGFSYLCGMVNYHKLEKDGEETPDGFQLHSERDDLIDLFQHRAEDAVTAQYDCFDKSIQYGAQNEWRIALYRGQKSTDAYVLDVGDLHDIAYWVRADQFVNAISTGLRNGKLNLYDDNGYVGNISRSELREKFYTLGDNKGKEFITIG